MFVFFVTNSSYLTFQFSDYTFNCDALTLSLSSLVCNRFFKFKRFLQSAVNEKEVLKWPDTNNMNIKLLWWSLEVEGHYTHLSVLLFNWHSSHYTESNIKCNIMKEWLKSSCLYIWMGAKFQYWPYNNMLGVILTLLEYKSCLASVHVLEIVMSYQNISTSEMPPITTRGVTKWKSWIWIWTFYAILCHKTGNVLCWPIAHMQACLQTMNCITST